LLRDITKELEESSEYNDWDGLNVNSRVSELSIATVFRLDRRSRDSAVTISIGNLLYVRTRESALGKRLCNGWT
jgi:hypothetical protein